MIAHGLTTKFFPLIFVAIAFLYISDYTRDSFDFIAPEDAFIGGVLILGSLIFIYEGFYSLTDARKSTVGSAGAVFFFIIAVLNFIMAIIILADQYQPFSDMGDLNLFLQGLLLADLVMLAIEGIYEIVIARRFTFHRAVIA